MTKLLDEAIASVKTLPAGEQDLVAKLLLAFADPNRNRYRLTDEQLAEVDLALAEEREGKFATEAEMAETWRRFGL
jgi:hypothetical protein